MALTKMVNGMPAEMTPEEEAAFVAQQDVDAGLLRVPQEISMAQARLALLQAGLLSLVEPAISGLPEPDRTAAQIEWEYRGALKRGNALVVAIASQLSLSPAQVDELFIAAAEL